MPVVTSVFLIGALLFIRFFVTLRFIPVLGDRPLPFGPSVGISLLLALFFLPEQMGTAWSQTFSFGVVLWALKEVFVGALLGMSVRLCWSILFFAGGIVHHFSANVTGSEEYLGLRQMYLFLGGGIFLLMDGHHALFTAVSHSLVGMPLGAETGYWMSGSADFTALILVVFSSAFSVGVLVAAPVFVVALTTEFLIGVSQRILGSRQELGALLRIFAAQGAVVFFLWKTVSVAVDFLQQNLEKIGQSIAN